jgi:hypothetical protein
MEIAVNADNAAGRQAATTQAGVGAAPLPESLSPAQPARWRQRPAVPEPTFGNGAATADAIDLPLDLPLDPSIDTAVPASTAPQCALHDDALWSLARRTQGAVLRLEFELRTSVARQAFRRDFVYVSRQLHGLEASRRVQGLDRALLNDALLAVQRRADDLQALFARIAAELEATLSAHGQAGAEIAFARPARFQATVVSPGARRFVDLVQHADATLCQVERAWLAGVLPPAARTALTSDCRRALVGFKEFVREHRHAIGEQVRKLNAQRSAVMATARS